MRIFACVCIAVPIGDDIGLQLPDVDFFITRSAFSGCRSRRTPRRRLFRASPILLLFLLQDVLASFLFCHYLRHAERLRTDAASVDTRHDWLLDSMDAASRARLL